MILISCMTAMPCQCGTLKTYPLMSEQQGRGEAGDREEGPAAKENHATHFACICKLLSKGSSLSVFSSSWFVKTAENTGVP